MDEVRKKLRNLNGSIIGIENFLIFLSNFCSNVPENLTIDDHLQVPIGEFIDLALDQNDCEKLAKIHFLIKERFFFLPKTNTAPRFIELLLNSEEFKKKKFIYTAIKHKKHNSFMDKIKVISTTWDNLRELKKTIHEQKQNPAADQKCVEAADNLLTQVVIDTISFAREDNTSISGIEKIKHAGIFAAETEPRIPDMVTGNISEAEIETYLEETKPLTLSESIWIKVVTFVGTVVSAFAGGLTLGTIFSPTIIGAPVGFACGAIAGGFTGGWGTYQKINKRFAQHSDEVSEGQEKLIRAAKKMRLSGKMEAVSPKQSNDENVNRKNIPLNELIKLALSDFRTAQVLIESDEYFPKLLDAMKNKSSSVNSLRSNMADVIKKHWRGLKDADVLPSNWERLRLLFTTCREIAVNVPWEDRINYLREKSIALKKFTPQDKQHVDTLNTIINAVPMIIADCKNAKLKDIEVIDNLLQEIEKTYNIHIFESVDLIKTIDTPLQTYLSDVKIFIEKSGKKFDNFCRENVHFADQYMRFYPTDQISTSFSR